MAQHTAGDWKVEFNHRGGSGFYVISEDGRYLADVNQRLAGLEREEAKSNANVMASGPKLLAASIEAEQAMTDEIERADLEDDDTHPLAPARELLRAAIKSTQPE